MSNDPGLRRLALRTLLAAFAGTTVPQWAIDLVDDGLAGHTLFGGNVVDPDQVRAATTALRAARPDVLIAIDEEGGDVTRLAHATGSPYPGNAALGAVDDPALTRQVYHAIGGDLAACGANLNLAPTVDVNTADDNPIIGTRSFGADPARVAAHAAAAVVGLADAGIAACAKHFPGHGATVTDSHLELPTVDVPLSVLRERDLPPFAAVISAGVAAIMTAHIRVPALTGDTPATLSHAALTGLLRQEYAYQGVIVTDALEMRGATLAAGGIAPAAVAALAAGADLLCIGARVDQALVELIASAIADAIVDGTLPRDRVEQAADRVGVLATAVGPAAGGTRSAIDLGYAAARRAIRVEGVLDGLDTALVVQLTAGSTIAEGRVPWGLGPHLGGVEQLRVAPAEISVAEVAAAAGGRPLVLVGRHLHRVPGAPELIEQLAARHPVSVVEMGWPSAWRPAGVRAFVTTYGASHANGRAAAEALGLAA
ncbi:glycoside hydrolase family 3 N-terminal domain-containing protein [Micromonospora sp. NBC_01813]|uniref:glycoside hydrolase family 3 N-terminal domain-containing protein n=1 Tax=Micromonospora sp. NBC_01813 TaxID=2975988 RepID=UPI002DD92D4A|nr:glycoside hydrolase family 3 N-terminal domain-containing protein [Micromonospora sp. NBC_01813]WSA11948.1 glycoside hydrolase family 3 protein [Micromonospora sp. NBC_01813]